MGRDRSAVKQERSAYGLTTSVAAFPVSRLAYATVFMLQVEITKPTVPFARTSLVTSISTHLPLFAAGNTPTVLDGGGAVAQVIADSCHVPDVKDSIPPVSLESVT